jgi:hypothetical protein
MAKKPQLSAGETPLETEQILEVQLIAPDQEKRAIEIFEPLQTELARFREQFVNVTVHDAESLEYAKKGKREMVATRNRFDKQRVEMFRPVDALKKMFKEKTDAFADETKKIESELDAKIDKFELEQQRKAAAEHIRRIELLQTSGWVMAGQFYHAGVNRIIFDEIDTASDEKLAEWVRLGKQHQIEQQAKAEADRLLKIELEKREAELAERERKLAERERELGLIQSAPVNQAAQVTPPMAPAAANVTELFPGFAPEPVAPPVPEQQHVHVEPDAGEIVRMETAEFTTEAEISQYRNMSISELRAQPEYRIYRQIGYNEAIDAVALAMEVEQEKISRADWIKRIRAMKIKQNVK